MYHTTQIVIMATAADADMELGSSAASYISPTMHRSRECDFTRFVNKPKPFSGTEEDWQGWKSMFLDVRGDDRARIARRLGYAARQTGPVVIADDGDMALRQERISSP